MNQCYFGAFLIIAISGYIPKTLFRISRPPNLGCPGFRVQEHPSILLKTQLEQLHTHKYGFGSKKRHVNTNREGGNSHNSLCKEAI